MTEKLMMRQVLEILPLKYAQQPDAPGDRPGLRRWASFTRSGTVSTIARSRVRLLKRVGELIGVPRPLRDMAWVDRELKRPGLTLQRLHLEYPQQQPDGYRYSQFRRHEPRSSSRPSTVH